MKAHTHLLSDILEMLSARHNLGRLAIAGDGCGGRFSRPTINGIRVDLMHPDLEVPCMWITIYTERDIPIQAQIEDHLGGEAIAQFVSMAVAMVPGRAPA